VAQLVKRKADLEKPIDGKLKELRDNHEQERQQLASELNIKEQKLNDDYQQHVSVTFWICFGSFNASTVV